MENMIHIGPKIDKEAVENLGVFVEKVFKAGHEQRMDQTTIVAALRLGEKLAQVNNASVMNCHLVGEKTVEVE